MRFQLVGGVPVVSGTVNGEPVDNIILDTGSADTWVLGEWQPRDEPLHVKLKGGCSTVAKFERAPTSSMMLTYPVILGLADMPRGCLVMDFDAKTAVCGQPFSGTPLRCRHGPTGLVQVRTKSGHWLAVDTGSAGTTFSGVKAPRGARCCTSLVRFDDEELELRWVKRALELELAGGGWQALRPHRLEYSRKKYSEEADGFLGRESLRGAVLCVDPRTPRVSIT